MRQEIIENLKTTFIEDTRVHAMWLEGSDGTGQVDAYSDIDLVLDVMDGHEEAIFTAIERALSTLGTLDMQIKSPVGHPKIQTRFYRLKEGGPYLILDVSIQSHSRKPEESHFVKGDRVEVPVILFDKGQVIGYRDYDWQEIKAGMADRLLAIEALYAQHARVDKYLKRGHYLEALLYYGKYVVEPIVDLVRMCHIPEHFYLHLIHISDHVPAADRQLLEKLYQNDSLASIEQNMGLAQQAYPGLLRQVKEQIGNY